MVLALEGKLVDPQGQLPEPFDLSTISIFGNWEIV
jgi:hypothetical protein